MEFLGGEPFALEDVAEMGVAPDASYLDAHAVQVGEPFHGARDLIVEARPAAPGIELVLRPIEGRATSLAYVRARLEVVFVLSGKRSFGSPMDDHCLLRTGQCAERRPRPFRHTAPGACRDITPQ
jgi:hypothetical protein